MSQGIEGPVGCLVARLGASIQQSRDSEPIYRSCLEAIAEHGTPAQQALVMTT